MSAAVEKGMGYYIYYSKSETSSEQFIKHLDSLMYENKRIGAWYDG